MSKVDMDQNALRIIENIKSRWSCRVFRDDPVLRDIVDIVLDAANYAPSPMNTQPWEFIVLTDKPLIEFRESVAEWLKSPREKTKK